jgi:DNA-binding GntR family transcriptional regulator
MSFVKLNLESPVPLYHQLQEFLRRKIAARTWRVGSQIPSEHELCRSFGVTRPTVRQALEGLVREGLLRKRRGKGAFVTDPPRPVGLFSVRGTSDAFAAQYLTVQTKVLHAGHCGSCIHAGGEDPAQGWIKLERVRSFNGIPTLFEYTWVDAQLAPGLEKVRLTNKSLYRALQERYGLRAGGGKQRFSAVAAEAKIARALRVRAGAPLLHVIRQLDLLRMGESTPVQNGNHPEAATFAGALRVDLYAAQGPFALEQIIPPLTSDELNKETAK